MVFHINKQLQFAPQTGDCSATPGAHRSKPETGRLLVKPGELTTLVGCSLGRGVRTTVWLSTTAFFSGFVGYFFGNFRCEASVITQRYAVRRQLFNDPKMHDLE